MHLVTDDRFPEYLTPEDAAGLLLRFNADWMRRQCRTGHLKASHVGGRWLIKLDDLEEFIEAAANQPRPWRRGKKKRRLDPNRWP